MKASFMLTTQRQNCNLHNGRVLGLQDPKKQIEDNAHLFLWPRGEFVPPGMTVNADFFCYVLRKLCENLQHKRPQKWRNQNLIIYNDNAPAHRSFKVSQFLAKNNMTVIPHPPYLPDLAPCDFFLFPKLKLQMKGRTFDTTEEIQEESQRVLDTIPKRDFQGCFQAWQKRWDCCIRAKGEYFEGDGGI